MKEYKLEDFVNKTNEVIKILKQTVNGDHNIDKQFLSEQIVYLLNVIKYADNYYSMRYFSLKYNKEIQIYVSNISLKKSRSKKIVDAYDIYKLKNLRLYYSGTVGSDPEIFVVDKTQSLIPAFKFLGSKDNPSKTFTTVGRTPKDCGQRKLYWDGFQAEFETSPESCLAWQVDSIQCGLKGTLIEARKFDKDAKLTLKNTLDVPFEVLETEKEEHVQFGCMPSFNVYNMKGRSMNGREVPFRSCGGHIHFGPLYKLSEKQQIEVVKALDAILGVACVSLFQNIDDIRRRSMYGLAGEYRLPPHGLEYRTLSNAWLCHPLITNIVFDLARKVFAFGRDGLLKHWQASEEEVINCINKCDVKLAQSIMKKNEVIFKSIVNTINNYDSTFVYNAVMNGVESIVVNPHDIESNWNLSSTWISHSDGEGKNFVTAIDLLRKKQKVS